MKMKQLSIAAIVMMGLGLSAAHAADEGTLNFHGAISSSACSLAASSKALTVNLDSVPIATVNALAGPSITSSSLQKPFTITLEGCPAAVKTASIKLSGSVSGTSNVFTSLSSGSMKYAGVVFTEAATGATIPANTVTAYSKPLVAGNNDLNYLVGYAKTGANNATAGTFSSVISYELSYL